MDLRPLRIRFVNILFDLLWVVGWLTVALPSGCGDWHLLYGEIIYENYLSIIAFDASCACAYILSNM